MADWPAGQLVVKHHQHYRPALSFYALLTIAAPLLDALRTPLGDENDALLRPSNDAPDDENDALVRQSNAALATEEDARRDCRT